MHCKVKKKTETLQLELCMFKKKCVKIMRQSFSIVAMSSNSTVDDQYKCNFYSYCEVKGKTKNRNSQFMQKYFVYASENL